jgi:zinc protease
MLRPLTLAIPLLAALPAASAEVTAFTLDNGLQVVVLEDHRAPVVVQTLWYKVGAADEPIGKSGIAHYLEHLMFKGTEKFGNRVFSDVVAANGGTDNAFTSQDYTGYIQRVASDRLDLIMEMEADRMTGLVLTEELAAPELDVVLEERNQRTENNPGALFAEQRTAAQYLNHPYSVPIIGWKHEVSALTLDDALEFYPLHYAPNNAVLVISGDADPDQVRVLADRFYAPIPANPAVGERDRVEEPPQLAERRLTFEDPRVAQPYVVRSYLAPERDAGAQDDAAALTMLAEVLGGSGATSVLGQALQFENPISVYTTAYYSGQSLDDTTFGLVIVPSDGVSLADAEAALDATIADFIDAGVDPEQLDRIKLQLRASQVYAEDNIDGLARRYGAGLTSGLTIADIEAWPDILQAVTGEDIIAAARLVFNKNNAVTGWLKAPDITPAAATKEVSQ